MARQNSARSANYTTRPPVTVLAAADHVVFVRGDKSLEFQHVAEVIDIAKGAGLNRIALMTD